VNKNEIQIVNKKSSSWTIAHIESQKELHEEEEEE